LCGFGECGARGRLLLPVLLCAVQPAKRRAKLRRRQGDNISQPTTRSVTQHYEYADEREAEARDSRPLLGLADSVASAGRRKTSKKRENWKGLIACLFFTDTQN
jgi:hypothetical protein